jgi:phosphate-selective porin OprO/OprP
VSGQKLFVFLVLSVLCLISTHAMADGNHPMSISAGAGGFLLTSPDGDFLLKFRGYIQSDARFFLQDQPSAIDTFTLRRVRPIFEGTVYKLFDFRIMPDFGGGTTVLQDAYLDAKFASALKVRFGKAKAPFGLERLQSATDIEFIERSLATNLVPNRDLGVQIYGSLASDKIAYQAAVMNGVVDGGSADTDTGQSKDLVVRIFITPVNGFGFGLAYSTGSQLGSANSPNLPSYKTSGQQTFFKYRLSILPETTTLANGTRYRYSPQFYLYHGPFGIFGEYVFSSQEVRTSLLTQTIGNSAWNLYATFVLTGEPVSYKAFAPKKAFDPGNGKFGAFEATFRYSRLDVDNDAFPIFADPAASASLATNWTAGLNWYLNKNVKFVFNYDQTGFQGGNLPTEKLFLSRFQLAF